MDNVRQEATQAEPVEETTEAVSQAAGQIAGQQTSSDDTDTASHTGDGDGTETGREATIPYKRFKEVNSKKKELEAEVKRLRDEAARRQPQTQTQTNAMPEGLDPAVAQQLKPYFDFIAQQNGYVKKEEIQRKEMATREQQAFESLAKRYSGADGSPVFDKEQIMDAAADILQNPESFYEGVYLILNKDGYMDYAAKQAKRQKIAPATEAKPGERKVGVNLEEALKKAQKTGSFKDVIKGKLFGQEI
jgi:hypothetical protein